MSDPETLNAYAERAEDYARKFKSGNRIDPALTGFMSELADGARVLDLGSGPGHAARIMADHGFRVTALEPVRQMLDMLADRPDIDKILGTFEDLSRAGRFHGVWANFSLLHASREAFPTYVAAIFQALKPGGVFHIGMKLGSGTARDKIGRLYTYYSETELDGILKTHGFRIVWRHLGAGEGLDGTIAPWITLRAHA